MSLPCLTPSTGSPGCWEKAQTVTWPENSLQPVPTYSSCSVLTLAFCSNHRNNGISVTLPESPLSPRLASFCHTYSPFIVSISSSLFLRGHFLSTSMSKIVDLPVRGFSSSGEGEGVGLRLGPWILISGFGNTAKGRTRNARSSSTQLWQMISSPSLAGPLDPWVCSDPAFSESVFTGVFLLWSHFAWVSQSWILCLWPKNPNQPLLAVYITAPGSFQIPQPDQEHSILCS